jgi:hypothetical protein
MRHLLFALCRDARSGEVPPAARDPPEVAASIRTAAGSKNRPLIEPRQVGETGDGVLCRRQCCDFGIKAQTVTKL